MKLKLVDPSIFRTINLIPLNFNVNFLNRQFLSIVPKYNHQHFMVVNIAIVLLQVRTDNISLKHY